MEKKREFIFDLVDGSDFVICFWANDSLPIVPPVETDERSVPPHVNFGSHQVFHADVKEEEKEEQHAAAAGRYDGANKHNNN